MPVPSGNDRSIKLVAIDLVHELDSIESSV